MTILKNIHIKLNMYIYYSEIKAEICDLSLLKESKGRTKTRTALGLR